jgi:hypothetical protein
VNVLNYNDGWIISNSTFIWVHVSSAGMEGVQHCPPDVIAIHEQRPVWRSGVC